MSELKLLNCPFCGGELEYSFLLGASDCKGCGVMIGFPKLTRHEDKIIATNTRKPMANIVEKLEELKNEDVCMETSCIECKEKYKNKSKKDCYEPIQKLVLDKAINIVKQEINNGLE